jgi:transposase
MMVGCLLVTVCPMRSLLRRTRSFRKSLRRKSGRKPGGQPGHPRSTLALVDKPDEQLRHEPGRCTGCGADLAEAPEVGMEGRQVFDLPPMTVRVTEHQLVVRRCACGTTTCGTAPKGVTARVQYGPRITPRSPKAPWLP